MRKWCGSPEFLLVTISILFLSILISGLGGCSSGQDSRLSKALRAIGGVGQLPPEAAIELQRFKSIFNAKSRADSEKSIEYFNFAFKRLRTSYVENVSDKKLINAAIKGIQNLKIESVKPLPSVLVEAALDSMTASLDPHTSYLNPEEFKESFVQTRGEFGGLGIEVTMHDGFVKVVAPIEGTPASRSGLQPGDLITHVDRIAIKGKSLREAVNLMRGTPGSKIFLKVRREGVADFTVTITRAVIKVEPVKWAAKGDIGYIKVSRFSERLQDGLIAAFASLTSEIGHQPVGIILDLRNNPGGLLDQSIFLADSLIDKGNIVSVRGRDPNKTRTFRAKKGDLADGVPIVVLINSGSASASEIVASALKHNGRATILGARSYGKGSVQTIIPLLEEGALKVTTALYYGPDGKSIQARGVSPHIRLHSGKVIKHKKESDLPRSILAVGESPESSQLSISESNCREVGDKKDRALGCALAFLELGKVRFLADHSKEKNM